MITNKEVIDPSERIRRGMLERVRSGLPSGTVPLGYRIAGSRLEPEQPTANLIGRAFKLIDSENLPVRTAMLKVTDAGLLTKRGQPLSLSAFQNLVANPLYAGFVRYGGKLYRGRHEPLISEEMFWRIQRKIGNGLDQPLD